MDSFKCFDATSTPKTPNRSALFTNDLTVNEDQADFLTNLEADTLCYDWVIEDLDLIACIPGQMFESPTFPSIDIMDTSEWSIRIYITKHMPNADDSCTRSDQSALNLNQTLTPELTQYALKVAIKSHLRNEEIYKLQPKVRISFSVSGDNNKPFKDYGCPMKTICFQLEDEEVVHVIEDFKYDDANDLYFNFSTNLLVKVSNGHKMKSKKFQWKIFSVKGLILMANQAEKGFFESLKFNFSDSDLLVTNCDTFVNTSAPTSKHRWSLHLYPQGRDPRYGGYLSMFLKHISGTDVQATAEFAITNHGNSKIKTTRSIPPQMFTIDQRWGIGNFMPTKEYPYSRRITITCRIKILDVKTQFIDNSLLMTKMNMNACDLLTQWYNEYRSQDIRCNFTLISKDQKEVKLHSTVLFTASQKFAMLVKKNNNGSLMDERGFSLDIDCSRESLLGFVQYLYTYRLKDEYNFNDLVQIFQLSVDFDMKALQQDCETLMKSNMTCDSLYKLLSSLDRKYFTLKLEKTVRSFIKQYFIEFTKDYDISLFLSDPLLKKILKISD